jgi:prepilin-type N-terminal cleavage/methylation domain-containing protein
MRRGFTLVEMLVVVAIMVILLSLVGRSFSTAGMRTISGSDRLSSSIGLAQTFATARNRMVWMKMETAADSSANTVLKFYQSTDGTNTAPVEFRRKVVLEMVKVREDLEAFASRPQVPTEDRMKAGGVLIFKPSGEVYMVNDPTGFPLPSGPLKMISEIGLQGVHGRTGKLVDGDLAAVQVRGLSGNPISYIR